MLITNVQYITNLDKEKSSVKATINGQEMFIPLNPDNRHYQAIQEWIAEGNTVIDNPPE